MEKKNDLIINGSAFASTGLTLSYKITRCVTKEYLYYIVQFWRNGNTVERNFDNLPEALGHVGRVVESFTYGFRTDELLNVRLS